MAINCCKGCVAPKRYPGCHGQCPEYLKEKAEYDAMKAAADKKKMIEFELDDQRNSLARKANKRRR